MQIKVGCGDLKGSAHNVTLEYSNDFGVSWNLLTGTPEFFGPECLHHLSAPSVFYPNSVEDWERYIIPLKSLELCG